MVFEKRTMERKRDELTEQGLITTQKDGKKLMYSIANPQTE